MSVLVETRGLVRSAEARRNSGRRQSDAHTGECACRRRVSPDGAGGSPHGSAGRRKTPASPLGASSRDFGEIKDLQQKNGHLLMSVLVETRGLVRSAKARRNSGRRQSDAHTGECACRRRVSPDGVGGSPHGSAGRRKTPASPLGASSRGFGEIRDLQQKKRTSFDVRFGGDEGTRTPDLCVANASLYHLSHAPIAPAL